MNRKKNILITGGAGFVGFTLAQNLLNEGYQVDLIDNLNSYYDVSLKKSRLQYLFKNFSEEQINFYEKDLQDYAFLLDLFSSQKYSCVINLAAQVGVRYCVENPRAYIESNLVGFFNILECVRFNPETRLIYASSSSVYGLEKDFPSHESFSASHPASIYGATKRSNELMAHSYSHLYGIESIGLRFFTVYGPWGRPDMAVYKFTDSILKEKPITVYREGTLKRDFTYIDDIVGAISKMVVYPFPEIKEEPLALSDPSVSSCKYRVFNIGNNTPITVNELIETIEDSLGKKAKIEYAPMRMEDVEYTFANVDKIKSIYDYRPKTNIKEGISNFIDWYHTYHNSK